MPEAMQYWEFVSLIAGLIVTILTPFFWFIKVSSKRNKEMSDRLLEQINETANTNHQHMREDLNEFRQHFDKSLQNVYESIRQNDKEVRDHITNQINEIKSFITEMEARIEAAREHNHQLEKNLLDYQRQAQEHFVTQSELDRVMGLRRQSDAPNQDKGE